MLGTNINDDDYVLIKNASAKKVKTESNIQFLLDVGNYTTR